MYRVIPICNYLNVIRYEYFNYIWVTRLVAFTTCPVVNLSVRNVFQMENKRSSKAPAKAAKRSKTKHLPSSILHYRGSPIREKTSEMKTIHLFDDTKVESFGLIPMDSQVFLSLDVEGRGSVLSASPIVGCTFSKNLGVKGCVESLLILFKDTFQEEKICICLDRS